MVVCSTNKVGSTNCVHTFPLRYWPQGAEQPCIVWTDHKNLNYICRAQHLSSRQPRRALSYRPSSECLTPDALSRRLKTRSPHPAPFTWEQPLVPARLLSELLLKDFSSRLTCYSGATLTLSLTCQHFCCSSMGPDVQELEAVCPIWSQHKVSHQVLAWYLKGVVCNEKTHRTYHLAVLLSGSHSLFLYCSFSRQLWSLSDKPAVNYLLSTTSQEGNHNY